MSNPLCSLYFFSDTYIDQPGSHLDLNRVKGRVKKAISEYETVKGFSFVRETSTDLPRSKVERIIENIGSKWVLYPHVAIIRYDGAVLGVHLANGSFIRSMS